MVAACGFPGGARDLLPLRQRSADAGEMVWWVRSPALLGLLLLGFFLPGSFGLFIKPEVLLFSRWDLNYEFELAKGIAARLEY